MWHLSLTLLLALFTGIARSDYPQTSSACPMCIEGCADYDPFWASAFPLDKFSTLDRAVFNKSTRAEQWSVSMEQNVDTHQVHYQFELLTLDPKDTDFHYLELRWLDGTRPREKERKIWFLIKPNEYPCHGTMPSHYLNPAFPENPSGYTDAVGWWTVPALKQP